MLAEARGFVFDLDGTLIQRGADGPAPVAAAVAVVAAVRRSGRPLVAFTNASHAPPAAIAAGVRARGLELADAEMLTPICSALGELRRRHPGSPVYAFATAATRERLRAAGVELLADGDAGDAEVVLVAHADAVDLEALEAAAYAVRGGAALLTASYAPAYAGANGPIISRGAMITAALAKAAERQPVVVGKPSEAAVRELAANLGVPAADVAVVGDDFGMDIALGQLGGSTTVLVRTGISAGLDLDSVPAERRPDHVLDELGQLLEIP